MTEFYNILTSLTFILLHFFLFAANFHIMKRKIIHPAVLFSLLWFVILLAHFVFSYTLLNELYPLHTSTYLLLFIGVRVRSNDRQIKFFKKRIGANIALFAGEQFSFEIRILVGASHHLGDLEGFTVFDAKRLCFFRGRSQKQRSFAINCFDPIRFPHSDGQGIHLLVGVFARGERRAVEQR